jgi:riboflavin kinase/FMN adenylyltransferase
MKTYSDVTDFPSFPKRTSVAIGNFDGVHLGHKKILKVLTDEAKNKDLLPIVLTFLPHPKKIVGEGQIHMLQTMDQRLREISHFPIHAALFLKFDKKLAKRTAQDFLENVVLQPLKAQDIIVGENFCFGRNREGCIDTLLALAQELNFNVRSVPPVRVGGEVVSSSNIRRLLWKGEIEKAATLLGRNYEIEGEVIRGKSRGRTLGFPTANIQTLNEITPGGVFLSEVTFEGQNYPSITNIGIRPTFQLTDKNIETYILNFAIDLYGKKIRIRFLKKVRDEMSFDTPGALAHQIQKDIQVAETFFSSRKNR